MSNLYITIGLLLWMLPITFNIYVDRNGHKPNYLKVFTLRAMAAVIHGLLFAPRDWYAYVNEYHWSLGVAVFLFQITSYWLVFEIGLNIVRKRIQQLGFWKGVLYYDQKEGDSDWIDRFFKWAGPTYYITAKSMALIVCILSIIYLYLTL
jgi:hypothetical protein